MHIGVDASNLRHGGGITHLVELLRVADPAHHQFERITVWSVQGTLDQLDDAPWLTKVAVPALDRSALTRLHWQHTRLDQALRRSGCDLLFVPGGSFSAHFRPVVTMSRNLLPFDPAASRLYGLSLKRAKLTLLRYAQSRSFRRASGVVFLTSAAQEVVERTTGPLAGATRIIPHGISDTFMRAPVEQRPITAYSEDRPFRLLYVSSIDLYKHQWTVVEAVARVRAAGLPVTLDLVGSPYPPAPALLRRTLAQVDPEQRFARYRGAVRYNDLPPIYQAADAFVFASSCENMPNSLVEAMASGLPIACSNRSVMPEVIGDAAVYFDPTDAGSIATAVTALVTDAPLRAHYAQAAFARASALSWEQCALATFRFLAAIANPLARP